MIEKHNYILKNIRIVDPGRNLDTVTDLGIMDGIMVDPSEVMAPRQIECRGLAASPGFIDLHVHLRQPGNTTAETIASGTKAAAAGGFTAIMAMPNTNPVTDSVGAVEYLRRHIALDAVVKVLISGAMSKSLAGEEMAPIGALKSAGVVAVTDDGRCVQNNDLMRHIVEYAKSFNLPILDHCEEKTLAGDGVMNEGKWSVLLGMNGLPATAEELIVARDILLAKQVGWKMHLQHLSTAGSVDMVRRARKDGLMVTGEATPHHLTLTEDYVKRYDTNFKMNPPLRSEADRQALIEGLRDGSITVIATDHAPHTATAKLVEFDDAPFGIIGLETAFGVVMNELYHKGVLTLPELIAKLTTGPADVIGWQDYSLANGHPADITIFDPTMEWTVNPAEFYSKSRNTPYDQWRCKGRVLATFVCGQQVFARPEFDA